MKQININNKIWYYQVGKQNTIIKDSEFKFVEKNWKIKDSDPYTFERGQWKKTSDGMIMPSDIKNYIFKNGHEINKKYLKSIGRICLCAECCDR